MIESVVALLMFVNGSINEARIQESMATCLRGKRQAERQYSEMCPINVILVQQNLRQI